ncbi:hypothetical protein [uncultured Chitinophaga sp.]|uniref:hypothetical protein n=1 Tax=uncultured Chitinophaga sp. TaxID=339340 RepID=UPI0025E6409C|nr:hypothetical protein [uncultured Chitinophaga sp.]
MTANRIINHIFHQPDLQHVDEAELERLVAQYPYFAAARLLLAQKKFAANHNLADESLKNAQLYSGTSHHLHQFLQGDEPVEGYNAPAIHTAPPVTVQTEPEEEQTTKLSGFEAFLQREADEEKRRAILEGRYVETPAEEEAEEEPAPSSSEDLTSQFTQEYYGADAAEHSNTTASQPVVYSAGEVEDQTAQFNNEYYGSPAATVAEEGMLTAAGREDELPAEVNAFTGEAPAEEEIPATTGTIENFVITGEDELPAEVIAPLEQSLREEDTDTFLLTGDAEPFDEAEEEASGVYTPAQNNIYNTVIDEPGETLADSSNIENDVENEAAEQFGHFIQSTQPLSPAESEAATQDAEVQLYNTALTSERTDIEDSNNIEAKVDEAFSQSAFHPTPSDEPVAVITDLAELEDNAAAIIEGAEAIELEAEDKYNTLVEAEENAAAIVDAAEAIEVEAEDKYNTLVEAEENAAAIVDAAEAIEVEAEDKYNTLVEAEENAAAIVDAAEAIEVEAEDKYNTLVEAEENAAAIVDAAEAIEVEAEDKYNILVEAEENATAIVDAAEAIEVEAEDKYNTLVEAEENAAAIVDAAEAIEVEAEDKYNTLVEAAKTADEETEAASVYNTTIDQPGETIEDTSNGEALLEEAVAEQFDNLTDSETTEPEPPIQVAAEEVPTLSAEDEIYNTTLDQPDETIEDTSNAAAELEEQTAEQFEILTDPEETKAGNTEDGPIKIFPLAMPAEEETLIFQPLYTEDYFAYKRIKEPERADSISDKGEAEMRSFTDWLRQMKDNFSGKSPRDWYQQQIHRLYDDEEPEVSEAVEKMAIESITFNNDIVSETLAEVWVRQHQYQKAILIYEKLSLLNPGKSAYFAQKIKDLQLQTDNNK